MKKAEQDLENAKQRTRKVYGADGTIIYTQDTDKIAKAQQKVDDTKLDILIDSLEKQKEVKEVEKDAALQTYETMIDDLEQQKKDRDEFFETVIEKLDNINNPQPTEDIDRVIDKTYDNPSKANEVKQGLKDVENAVKENEKRSEDNAVKKASLSKVDTKTANTSEVNGQIEPTSNNNFDSFMKMVYNMAGKEPDGYERWKRGEYSEGNKVMSNIFSDNSFMSGAIRPFEDAINSFNETLAKASVTNVEKQQSVNVTFSGGINIQNPVGEVHQFAKELLLQLPTAFKRQMYTNLKY